MFLENETTFCFIIWKYYRQNNTHRISFSKSRNKRLQYYQRKKSSWSGSKKWKSQKIGTGQGDDYTNSCLLDYTYFKENYELTTIDLSKKKTLGADRIAIQKINFIGNLEWTGNTAMFCKIDCP